MAWGVSGPTTTADAQVGGSSYLPLSPDCGPNAVEDEQGSCSCLPGYAGKQCAPDSDLDSVPDSRFLILLLRLLAIFLNSGTTASLLPILAKRIKMKMGKETGNGSQYSVPALILVGYHFQYQPDAW